MNRQSRDAIDAAVAVGIRCALGRLTPQSLAGLQADETDQVFDRTLPTLSDLGGLEVNALVASHWEPEPPRGAHHSSMLVDGDPSIDHHPIESEPMQLGHDALRLLGSGNSPCRVE